MNFKKEHSCLNKSLHLDDFLETFDRAIFWFIFHYWHRKKLLGYSMTKDNLYASFYKKNVTEQPNRHILVSFWFEKKHFLNLFQ